MRDVAEESWKRKLDSVEGIAVQKLEAIQQLMASKIIEMENIYSRQTGLQYSGRKNKSVIMDSTRYE